MNAETGTDPETDIPADPIPENPEVAELTAKLGRAEGQNAELLRTLAEFQNTRKREARDLDIERKFAGSKLANDLLPALDNLDRALLAAKQAGDQSPLAKGVMATQMQLMDILKRHGITKIESLGKPFDANFHQAVTVQPSADIKPDHVMDVLQQGFMIHDRVLRPASVVIAQMPTAPVVHEGK